MDIMRFFLWSVPHQICQTFKKFLGGVSFSGVWATPSHPGGPGQDQIQPTHPAAGGGLCPAAAGAERTAKVQRETLRQLLQSEIQGLPVRG